jgi:hypothetical protein
MCVLVGIMAWSVSDWCWWVVCGVWLNCGDWLGDRSISVGRVLSVWNNLVCVIGAMGRYVACVW